MKFPRRGPDVHPELGQHFGLGRPAAPNAPTPEVFTITGAQRSLSQEQTGRTRKYLISMGIRTACVLAAIVVPGWPRWILIAGAVVLPYLAVVIANVGRERDQPGHLGVTALEQPALGQQGKTAGLIEP